MNAVIAWSETDYAKLDKGIVPLVRALHLMNLTTVASCEGHIRARPSDAGVYPWPWVIMATAESEMRRLQGWISVWNSSHYGQWWILSRRRIYGSYTDEYIAASYPDLVVKVLVPEDENSDLSATKLASLQRQVPLLAQFLASPA